MKKRIISLLLAACLFVGLLASCEAKTYTVTFETNGGTAVLAVTLAEGEPLSAPAVPTKEGYTFDGWYADAAFAEAYVFGKMPAKDITLYAKWKTVKKENVTVTDGGDRGEDGSWKSVDFKGQEVKISVSVGKDVDCSFPAADIYTMGPDVAGANEVAKAVLARNAAAKEALGITVSYSVKDLPAEQVHDDIRTIVQTGPKDAPDIYNNDMYGLSRAMIDGFLWNVKNPGDGVKSYFDFENYDGIGWYGDFMKGCTVDREKLYLLAGDYFIDMLRMAWAVYVNNDMMAANTPKMPSWYTELEDFYAYVLLGGWDIDMLADLSCRVHVSGTYGQTTKNDPFVGLAIFSDASRIVSAASGVTVYYQDAWADYAPDTITDVSTYQKVSDKYVSLLSTSGVYQAGSAADAASCFAGGNFLFAVARVGELEGAAMKRLQADVGVVPLPLWDMEETEDYYHTVVDEHAEIGCILSTARAYSAASALMQYLNEESGDVLAAYCEKALGLDYTAEDMLDATMIEILRMSADATACFGYAIGPLCEEYYTGVGTLEGLSLEKNAELGAIFASERDAYAYCLGVVVDKFAELD